MGDDQYAANVKKFKEIQKNSESILKKIASLTDTQTTVTGLQREIQEKEKLNAKITKISQDDKESTDQKISAKDKEIEELLEKQKTDNTTLNALYDEYQKMLKEQSAMLKYKQEELAESRKIQETFALNLDKVEDKNKELELKIRELSDTNELLSVKLENCNSRAGYVVQSEYIKLKRNLTDVTRKQQVLINKLEKDYKNNTEHMNSTRLIFFDVVKEIVSITSSQPDLNSLSADKCANIVDRFNDTLNEYIETILKQYATHYTGLYVYTSDNTRSQIIKNERDIIVAKLVNFIQLLRPIYDEVSKLLDYKKNNEGDNLSNVLEIVNNGIDSPADTSLFDLYDMDVKFDDLQDSDKTYIATTNPFEQENNDSSINPATEEKPAEAPPIQISKLNNVARVKTATSVTENKFTLDNINTICQRLLQKMELNIPMNKKRNIQNRENIIAIIEGQYKHCRGDGPTAKQCKMAVNTIIDDVINPARKQKPTKLGGLADTIISGGCLLLSKPALSIFLAACVLILLYLIYINIYLPRKKQASKNHAYKIKAAAGQIQLTLPDSLYYTSLLY